MRKEIVHPHDKPEGKATFVGLEHLESGTGRRIGSHEVDLTRLTGRKPRFYEGDIVYGYLRPYLNKVWVAEFDGLCSVDQYVYEVDRSMSDPEYIAWFMRSPHYLGGAPVSTGPGQLPRIRLEEVAAVELDLPDLVEQRRIVSKFRDQLGELEPARAAAEAELESVAALTAAYVRSAFRGITPLAVSATRDPAPEGWLWVRLSELARLESGHTPSRYHPEWWGGSIPWISLSDIRGLDGRVAYTTLECTNEAGIANSAARLLPPGTVVLSRTASIGFVTILGREMATSQDFVNWVCGPDLDPRFLAYLLRAARRYLRSLSSGAIHQTIYVPTVESFTVCVPRIDEQRRIAETLKEQLKACEQLRHAVAEQLDAFSGLRGAALRRVFSVEL